MEFFRKIISKIMLFWQRAKEKRVLFQFIMNAAYRGRFSDEEIRHIEAQKINLKQIRANAYIAALSFIEITSSALAEEIAEIDKIQVVLRIPNDEIEEPREQLSRLRSLVEIRAGNLPLVPVNGIILRKAETPHWSEPAELLEERVVGRRYEGGSQGMSIRIAKGLSYRIGAQKGRLITDKAMVSVSKGDLIITNQRVIFQGSMKSINLPFTKLLEFRCLDDGIVLTNDKGKPCFIQFFNSKNGAIVEAIFLKLVHPT